MFPAFTLASARSEGPRQEAVHNDLVRTVVVPGAGHCVRRDQPARYLWAVDAFLAGVARAGQARNEEAPDEEGASPEGGVDSSSLTLAEG